MPARASCGLIEEAAGGSAAQSAWMEENAGVPRMTAMQAGACSHTAPLMMLAARYLEAAMAF